MLHESIIDSIKEKVTEEGQPKLSCSNVAVFGCPSLVVESLGKLN